MKSLFIVLLGTPAGGNGAMMQFVMLGLIIVVFYFFMIRPQTKRQKEMKNFRESLKKGDKVITTGGIYGRIAEISDNTVILEVEDKMRLKVDKAALIKDPSDIEQGK
jgi:preprotein translocase subunit YajC